MPTPTYRKKLIEVALPLDAINAESAREKSIRHGHPSTLHLWWARRPLAACRAVLFASLVDDPGEYLPPDEAKKKREDLFKLITHLVKWENSNNEAVLSDARREIAISVARTHGITLPTDASPAQVAATLKQYAPPVLDPFAGGGSIPLEAQRLGLEAHASDLNPVAVLINKALIELPAKFRDHRPVNPDAQHGMRAEAAPKSALAEDVRWYGKWMREEAYKRIGHLYPKGPNGETVIAWLWARTVKCPNPACGAQMPLVRSFALSTKKGKEAWVEPIVDHAARNVWFKVRQGTPTAEQGTAIAKGTKTGRGANFACIVCGTAPEDAYIKAEGMQNRLGATLMAVVADGKGGRLYLSPDAAQLVQIEALPDTMGLVAELPDDPRNVWCKQYGLTTYADLFTPRQLVALTTFSDLVGEARALVLEHSKGDAAYADSVATYLSFAVDKAANLWSSITTWMSDRGALRETFARQAIPMAWDFAEANPLSDAGGNIAMFVERIENVIAELPNGLDGECQQLDAASSLGSATGALLSTDPPYYDNISYANLSDFFYVWLRRSLGKIYPALFSTLLTPKAQELIATPYRFEGSMDKARHFFEKGLGKAFTHMHAAENPSYPLTVYYAYKQSEDSNGDGATASTGWETMLQGLLDTNFSITGTWPMRTEGAGRIIAGGTNALASSIVLVCRPRHENAPIATRREFVRALQQELPAKLDLLIKGTVNVSPITPVDLAQSAIGPGMAIFSRYSQVLESTGEPMRVRVALELINAEIDRYFAEQEGEQDGPTRFCLAWYRTYGTGEGKYGDAETLSKATNIDVRALDRQGLLTSTAGKVRIKPAGEYPVGAWDPSTAHPLSTWEATHRLVRALTGPGGGVETAAPIVYRLGGKAEEARALAYLLYTEANKHGWLDEARGYNDLVAAWPDLIKRAADSAGPEQGRLL